MFGTSSDHARRRPSTAGSVQLLVAVRARPFGSWVATHPSDDGCRAEGMSPRFDAIYGEDGRRSIPPERLLRALLLQLLYSVRSERMLMEQLEYNLLFRWFVGLAVNEPVWHPTVFTKNRRPAAGRRCFRGVLFAH